MFTYIDATIRISTGKRSVLRDAYIRKKEVNGTEEIPPERRLSRVHTLYRQPFFYECTHPSDA